MTNTTGRLGGATLQLVLLVSCAHALVHVYELSLPSVEQEIAAELVEGGPHAGKRMTGLLSTFWRIPFGLGAFAAGWLVDRFGARRMLAAYLLGCSATCLAAALPTGGLSSLFPIMFLMGTFASIYHPAGLALISHETHPANRPRALGWHGIFGSAGIATAPLLIGVLLATGWGWRHFYAVLAVPGLFVGIYFLTQIHRDQRVSLAPALAPRSSTEGNADGDEQEYSDWSSFFTLTLLAVMQGFIYSGVLSFLKRYLTGTDTTGDEYSLTTSSYLTSGVLLAGCVGQYLSASWAKPERLEQQLSWVCFANAPFLLWMAMARGHDRIVAAGLFSVVHFMHQPIYNSLIAKYSPRSRRSLCYGFSFAMGLGVGGIGATFVGFVPHQFAAYSVLAMVALAAGSVGLILRVRNRPTTPETWSPPS